jgi:hypothetical protein
MNTSNELGDTGLSHAQQGLIYTSLTVRLFALLKITGSETFQELITKAQFCSSS